MRRHRIRRQVRQLPRCRLLTSYSTGFTVDGKNVSLNCEHILLSCSFSPDTHSSRCYISTARGSLISRYSSWVAAKLHKRSSLRVVKAQHPCHMTIAPLAYQVAKRPNLGLIIIASLRSLPPQHCRYCEMTGVSPYARKHLDSTAKP